MSRPAILDAGLDCTAYFGATGITAERDHSYPRDQFSDLGWWYQKSYTPQDEARIIDEERAFDQHALDHAASRRDIGVVLTASGVEGLRRSLTDAGGLMVITGVST